MAVEVSDKMITTSGVADMLHIHVNTVRRWSNLGILKSYRIGPRGDRRFIRDDIKDFLTVPYSFSKAEKENRITYSSKLLK